MELMVSGALEESIRCRRKCEHSGAGASRFRGRNDQRRTAASVPADLLVTESQAKRRDRDDY